MVRLFTVGSTLAVLLSQGMTVQAADPGQTNNPNRNVQTNRPALNAKIKGGMARPATADKDYAHEKLTTFVEVPDVPKYSGAGAVFISGLKYPNDQFGQDITMTFGVLEQASQVNDWYKAALQQYQWTIYPTNNNSTRDGFSIDAGKGKYNVGLIIKSVANQPYRTRVVIRYKFGK